MFVAGRVETCKNQVLRTTSRKGLAKISLSNNQMVRGGTSPQGYLRLDPRCGSGPGVH